MALASLIVFLTPAAALVCVATVLPLAAAARGAAQTQRVRAALGLTAPLRQVNAFAFVALAAIVVLLGVAAAQPVLSRTSAQQVRTDAQALFVLDISQSMNASAHPGSATRLERARTAARTLRAAIPQVEAGVATLTDRILPDLMPVADAASFDSTIERSVQIEEPPPRVSAVRATSFAALEDVPAGNYFRPSARRRVVVLLTDGETQPVDESRIARALADGTRISLMTVRFWRGDESIHDADGKVDTAYHPDPTGALSLDALASATRGKAFEERDVARAVSHLDDVLGSGPTRAAAVRQREDIVLAPFLAALALVPLALLIAGRELAAGPLWRRFARSYD